MTDTPAPPDDATLTVSGMAADGRASTLLIACGALAR